MRTKWHTGPDCAPIPEEKRARSRKAGLDTVQDAWDQCSSCDLLDDERGVLQVGGSFEENGRSDSFADDIVPQDLSKR
jgi:hypothetical protein